MYGLVLERDKLYARADQRVVDMMAAGFLDEVRGLLAKGYSRALPSMSGIGYAQLAAHGINFARVWISSIFGASWNTWIGGRNQYGGYLPITGLVPTKPAAISGHASPMAGGCPFCPACCRSALRS